jgi:peptidoglycan/LPS O-acetylase OafA/YrhL
VNHGAVNRILTSGLLAWVGTLSYSIYLCHWVVLQAANQAWKLLYHEALGASFSCAQSAIALTGLMAATLGLASGMSRMVEMPGRRWLRARLCGGAADPGKRVSRFVV